MNEVKSRRGGAIRLRPRRPEGTRSAMSNHKNGQICQKEDSVIEIEDFPLLQLDAVMGIQGCQVAEHMEPQECCVFI